MAIIRRCWAFLEFWYYQYLLHTALYMLESWERTLFNSLLVAVFAMASYSLYLYLPGHVMMLVHFVDFLCNFITGSFNPTSALEQTATTAAVNPAS
ncbi:hypothetical protein NP493_269g00015 [Ridgeia piscesae]|uniref:Serine palmitoyltransferase small subunit B n=1 Tax=Ridgeia piscesae TaxID=27915 RepID=A0AAD9NXN0_RIDPI|nr:hypothetical protein NP493_269g00015 [Ridgeia piscesae]